MLTTNTGPKRAMRHLLALGFPRLDPNAPDIHFLLRLPGLRQVSAKVGPQAVPGLRCPFPGESDLQEVSQVLLCVHQEGVGGIQPDPLHSARGERSWSHSPATWKTATPVG